MDPTAAGSPDGTVAAALPRRELALLSLAALGVVFGDIGTSPLYAMRECFGGTHPVPVDSLSVLGVLSLIFWALALIISVKYMVFILRADNRGEGGVLALTTLVVPPSASARTRPAVAMLVGMFGASLLFADGVITPTISVLSALEGADMAAPGSTHGAVVWIAIAILVALFLFQPHGAPRVGVVFGPVLLVWFVTLSLLGIVNIWRTPAVLAAISPHYAVRFFLQHGWQAYLTLGTVFLAVTGGEMLYAFFGHFGRRPIRITWFSLVLPALVLNYFGQGAFLLAEPAEVGHPLFAMAPGWMRLPLVALATAAAVVVAQAIITGAYSLTLQAVQLGYFPRIKIRHTSPHDFGQIYIPAVNWALMFACILAILWFRSSSDLAAAYGVAIALDMVITSILFYALVRMRWGWNAWAALAVCGSFLTVEAAFLGANLTKILSGGWFPLAIAGTLFLLMTTWRRGRQLLSKRMRESLIPLELFLADLLSNPPIRVPGVAAFMSSNPVGTPPALRHNVAHNRVWHETVLIVCVETAEVPLVADAERIEVEEIGENFWRLSLKYGFMEKPDVPAGLAQVRHPRLHFDEKKVSYFLGRETLLSTNIPGMARWRERLFASMSRNGQSAMAYFRLPPDRVVEVGVQVQL